MWYEDIEVGDRFETEPGHAIELTEENIIAFAREYDPQPGHVDPDLAETSFFHGLAASGWHTAAVTMRLLAGVGFPIGNGIVGAGVELAWPTPARPGDRLHLTLEVTSKRLSRSKPDRGIVVVDYDTINQDGEVRQRTHTTLIVFRRPDSASVG
jgi:acyl dehydratase